MQPTAYDAARFQKPASGFNVWGRLSGGAGAFSGTTLSRVTSGVGTSNQTTTVIGSFSKSNPVGWTTYQWVPLLDSNGNPAMVQLNGQATLQLTSGGNLNAEFLMLTPALATPAVPFPISARLIGGNIQITIPTLANHSYTLLYSASLSPTSWTPVGSTITGDGSNHVINQPVSGAQGYYRVSVQ